jgi:ubiquinone/menaquinone biosynthesis C-methylase UbiE
VLLHGAIADFVPDRAPSTSIGARAMQSRWLAGVYERWWRPVLFAIGTRFGGPGVTDEVRRVVESMAGHDGPWLDVSCGPGTLLGALVRAAGERRVVGLDLSRAMLERAQTVAPRASLVRADASDLPFEDAAFGAVANLAALDLYPDPARVVRECARVLAPGGRWVCSTFVAPRGSSRTRSALGAASGVDTPSLDEVAAWAEAAGLRRFGHVLFRRYAIAWADRR